MSQRIKLRVVAWVPEAKEVQDATICWQGDGHSILGRKRRYYVGLFTQEKYSNWSIPVFAKTAGLSDKPGKFYSILQKISVCLTNIL